MNCPKCNGKTCVKNSSPAERLVLRERMCYDCGYRFYTKEALISSEVGRTAINRLHSIKRSERRAKLRMAALPEGGDYDN